MDGGGSNRPDPRMTRMVDRVIELRRRFPRVSDNEWIAAFIRAAKEQRERRTEGGSDDG